MRKKEKKTRRNIKGGSKYRCGHKHACMHRRLLETCLSIEPAGRRHEFEHLAEWPSVGYPKTKKKKETVFECAHLNMRDESGF